MTDAVWTLPAAGHPVTIRLHAAGIEWAAAEIARAAGARRGNVLLVTDERVALHYAQPLNSALTASGFTASEFVFPPGEQHKRLYRVAAIVDQLAEQCFDRADLVIGLGGGVATDIAGFAAAIYRRGIDWVAVPTSLLAMVDAAIGGKTGVDHPLGKNLIGVFHQPRAVLAPLLTLQTLDEREWRSGSAEVIKAALLSGGKLWEMFSAFGFDLFAWNRDQAQRAIVLAADYKISIVTQDERETGVRRVLNFGHTFGHALETVTGFQAFTHGEAVLLGMRAAVRMSAGMRLLSVAVADAVEAVLAAALYPHALIAPADLLNALSYDKKIAAGKQHWVLLEDIGRPVVRADVPPELVQKTAAWLCELAAAGAESIRTPRRLRCLVLNGPNLNLLGTREVQTYGSQSYVELAEFIEAAARDLAADVLIRQSNSEGELVDLLHRARHWADGIVINPGGYSHTSVALRDAIAAVQLPVVEVHLTDINRREDFRRRSLTGEACADCIVGRGFAGYKDALAVLSQRVQESNQ